MHPALVLKVACSKQNCGIEKIYAKPKLYLTSYNSSFTLGWITPAIQSLQKMLNHLPLQEFWRPC